MDEEQKVSRNTEDGSGEDPAQFYNEFSSWRTNQQQTVSNSSPNKQTELTDLKQKKPAQK